MVRGASPRVDGRGRASATRASATDALNAPEVVPNHMDFDAPAPSDDRLPAGTRIGRAALRVADLDETTAFYRDVVGLRSSTATTTERPSVSTGPSCSSWTETPIARGGVGPTPASFTPRSAFPTRRDRRGAGPCARAVAARRRFRPPRQRGAVPRRSRRQRRGDLPATAPRWPVDDDGTVQMATEPLDIEGVSGAAGERTPTATSSTASRPAPTWVTCISKSPRCRRSRRCTSTASASRSG